MRSKKILGISGLTMDIVGTLIIGLVYKSVLRHQGGWTEINGVKLNIALISNSQFWFYTGLGFIIVGFILLLCKEISDGRE